MKTIVVAYKLWE